MTTNRSRRGFALTELIIVLAIVGMLAAVAVPNFVKFTARQKQAEAKANLGGFYTSARAYFLEQATYACGNCNFVVEPGNRYTYGWSPTAGQNRSINVEVDGCRAQADTQTTSTFRATAAGNIDDDLTCDVWTIDQGNNLVNVQNDLEN